MGWIETAKIIVPYIVRMLPRLVAALEDGKITNMEVLHILFGGLESAVSDAERKNIT